MSKVWGFCVVLVVFVVVFVFDETWQAILVGSVIGTLFMGLAKAARTSERKEEQIKRDQAAQTILGQLKNLESKDIDKPC